MQTAIENELGDENNKEGFVLYWPKSQKRVKVKFEEYCRLHRLIHQCSTRSIWEQLRKDGKLGSELLDRVPDEFREWVVDTAAKLGYAYKGVETVARSIFEQAPKTSRKDFALHIVEYKAVSAVCFAMLDGKDYSDIIWKMIEPKYSTPFKKERE